MMGLHGGRAYRPIDGGADSTMILAADKGTRLFPPTREMPEPTAPVVQRPQRILALLATRVPRGGANVEVDLRHLVYADAVTPSRDAKTET